MAVNWRVRETQIDVDNQLRNTKRDEIQRYWLKTTLCISINIYGGLQR